MKSPWILADTNPYHVGWYEVKGSDFVGVDGERTDGIVRRYWSGDKWKWKDPEVRNRLEDAVMDDDDAWRGLVSEA